MSFYFDVCCSILSQTTAQGWSALPFCGQDAFVIGLNDAAFALENCNYQQKPGYLYGDCLCRSDYSTLSNLLTNLAGSNGCGGQIPSSVISVFDNFCAEQRGLAASLTGGDPTFTIPQMPPTNSAAPVTNPFGPSPTSFSSEASPAFSGGSGSATDSTGISAGAKVGIGVGVGLVVLILVVIASVIIYRRWARATRAKKEWARQNPPPSVGGSTLVNKYVDEQHALQNMHDPHTLQNMNDPHSRQTMSGSHYPDYRSDGSGSRATPVHGYSYTGGSSITR